MPVTRAMGMFMPPESERNTPENQAKLDVMYDITNRAYVPRSYSSKSLGEKTASLEKLYKCITYFIV